MRAPKYFILLIFFISQSWAVKVVALGPEASSVNVFFLLVPPTDDEGNVGGFQKAFANPRLDAKGDTIQLAGHDTSRFSYRDSILNIYTHTCAGSTWTDTSFDSHSCIALIDSSQKMGMFTQSLRLDRTNYQVGYITKGLENKYIFPVFANDKMKQEDVFLNVIKFSDPCSVFYGMGPGKEDASQGNGAIPAWLAAEGWTRLATPETLMTRAIGPYGAGDAPTTIWFVKFADSVALWGMANDTSGGVAGAGWVGPALLIGTPGGDTLTIDMATVNVNITATKSNPVSPSMFYCPTPKAEIITDAHPTVLIEGWNEGNPCCDCALASCDQSTFSDSCLNRIDVSIKFFNRAFTKPVRIGVMAAPNPFNPKTLIDYLLPNYFLPARIDIFDVNGRQIWKIVHFNLGNPVVWNGRDHWGFPVPSGSYIIRLKQGDWMATTNVVLKR